MTRRTSRKPVRKNSRRRTSLRYNARAKKPSDKLRDMEVPMVLGGYELDRKNLVPVRPALNLAPGDYGCDPLGGGMFRMVPSGDIVDAAEKERRLKARGLRRNATNALASTFFHVFSGILTQYDQKETARETKRGGRGNIYRLGHLLKALHNIEDSVRGFVGDDVSTAIQIRAAIDVNFTPGNPGDKLRKVVDAYLEHGTLPKYPVTKAIRMQQNGSGGGCAYCVSPPGRHKWWCKKLAKNGGKQVPSGDFAAMQRGYNGLAKMARDASNKAHQAFDRDDYRSAVKWYRAAANYHRHAASAAAPRDKQEHLDMADGCEREAEIFDLPPAERDRARGYR